MPIVAVVDGMMILLISTTAIRPAFTLRPATTPISIATVGVIDGDLPVAKRRVLDWAREHKTELSAAWAEVRREQKPERIR